ncbi:hypothetical protein GOODEAATRI_018436 [Goodea atripinnis]|uniref:Uncharacterized protein n=1 Tax=Goodea atripinnis TaxID=208336 RepID=A0ABV0PPS5_9TELE
MSLQVRESKKVPKSLSCNLWVAGSNPLSVCLCRCVLGQNTSSDLPADGGQRMGPVYGSLTSVSGHQCSCGYIVAHHCHCVIGWMTACSVKGFGVSGDLIKRYTSAGHLLFVPVHGHMGLLLAWGD